MSEIKKTIQQIVNKHKNTLDEKIRDRESEMKLDNFDHYLIYNVLGITNCEGQKIDKFHHKGRLLYRRLGDLMEEVTILCFRYKYGDDCKKVKIENTESSNPKKFEIDFLIEDELAHEIKWRDATTDGDHITKERNRIKSISKKGYVPIRLMYYYPNREQAKKIQSDLEDLYKGIGGEYYKGEKAWKYVQEKTGIDLQQILKEIIS